MDAEVLTVVAQACRDEERLEFAYVARDGERTDRRVEPHTLVSVERRWYLVAYDLGRFDWRSFRLDRLADPHPTGQRFRPRELPADDAAAFVTASLGAAAETLAIEAIVHAPLDQVQTAIGRWATAEAMDAATTRIHLSADSADWALFGLAAADAPFEVLAPPEVVERARVWGERFTDATRRLP